MSHHTKGDSHATKKRLTIDADNAIHVVIFLMICEWLHL